jgi:hypothetical protein
LELCGIDFPERRNGHRKKIAAEGNVLAAAIEHNASDEIVPRHLRKRL